MRINKFKTEPYEDFSLAINRLAMEKAIAKVEVEFGKEYNLVIGGKYYKTAKKLFSYNPSDPCEIVGVCQQASYKQAEVAIKAATDAFSHWRFVPVENRANYLFKAASIIRKRKMELAATMILEVGKNWLEAIADVAEAIDFVEFYAREMLRVAHGYKLTPFPGEKNQYIYIPLGVGIVIAPWNFPLAILVGMTVAPVVAGNTVIVKPSSNSPVVAAKFMEIMEEVGLPAGVINFVTGSGGKIGNVLVKHPKTRFINFTGSKDVGLWIVEQGAKKVPGQKWIKRVSAEMGGKNAIIIDREADLDKAIEGAVLSAYGYGGQKCSACSRLIVDKSIYNEVIERLAARIKRITIGPVKYQKNYLGPVIDDRAEKKILNYIKIGKTEGKLLCGGKKVDIPGYFIEPTVFIDIKPHDRMTQKEIFGPVLSVIKSEDFGESLAIANDTEYGLTGGVFSRNEKKLEKAKQLFHVGNLYLNRKITGALVDIQPFGGYNMSGTCAKAGGPDYLSLFLQGKSSSQRL